MSEHTHTYTHEHAHDHDGQGHEHEHTHTYTHDHEGGDQEHTHEHPDHDHDSAHTHDHGPMASKEQAVALLNYTYMHNTSHADELVKLAEKLISFGHEDAAAKVEEARNSFEQGNTLLAEALKML